MDKVTEDFVRNRAHQICEYCHAPQSAYFERFQIDHVVARQHRGPTVVSNLALCCVECNQRKGPNLSGIDPITVARCDLFDPRNQEWNTHFGWHGPMLVGKTPTGRATVNVLDMNRVPRVLVRQALIDEGRFPPPGDALVAA